MYREVHFRKLVVELGGIKVHLRCYRLVQNFTKQLVINQLKLQRPTLLLFQSYINIYPQTSMYVFTVNEQLVSCLSVLLHHTVMHHKLFKFLLISVRSVCAQFRIHNNLFRKFSHFLFVATFTFYRFLPFDFY